MFAENTEAEQLTKKVDDFNRLISWFSEPSMTNGQISHALVCSALINFFILFSNRLRLPENEKTKRNAKKISNLNFSGIKKTVKAPVVKKVII